MGRLAVTALTAAVMGALAFPHGAAEAAASTGVHRVLGTAQAGAGGGDSGTGSGTGTGSAINSSGGSPVQQAAITVNGLSTFQAAVCNQRMQTCNINQQLWTDW